MSDIKRLTDHVPKSRRNQDQREKSRSPTVAETKEWITAGALAAGQKLYTQLSEQHRQTFEMQEAGFMAVVEGLHRRLCVLEDAQGIASPELPEIRAALEDAIVAFQNRDPEESGEEETGLASPCRHDQVTEGNPAKCIACGENVSVHVDPRVEVGDEGVIETVRNTLGERWNTLSMEQRREAVRVYREADARRVQPVTLDPTVQ